MTQVVVPVRYPLSEHSKTTLATAVDTARERDASLTVLHVNRYQNSSRAMRADLKTAVEREFGRLESARFVVRNGLLVEETLLDEIVAEEADVVVIGKKQTGRWRAMIRRIVDDPDIEHYLREELDCEVVTAQS
jgi:nucleotide-binding universal stress UspA family protein